MTRLMGDEKVEGGERCDVTGKIESRLSYLSRNWDTESLVDETRFGGWFYGERRVFALTDGEGQAGG